jgi:phosphate starvation-inducible protein PhoH
MVSKKKLNISSSELNTIKPITDNQKEVFASYEKGQNLFLYGVAGTGKTYLAMKKTNHICIKYHIKTWYDLCFNEAQTLSLIDYTQI